MATDDVILFADYQDTKGSFAVSYLWKVTDAKNFPDFRYKLNTELSRKFIERHANEVKSFNHSIELK